MPSVAIAVPTAAPAALPTMAPLRPPASDPIAAPMAPPTAPPRTASASTANVVAHGSSDRANTRALKCVIQVAPLLFRTKPVAPTTTYPDRPGATGCSMSTSLSRSLHGEGYGCQVVARRQATIEPRLLPGFGRFCPHANGKLQRRRGRSVNHRSQSICFQGVLLELIDHAMVAGRACSNGCCRHRALFTPSIQG